jgi:hypothetical protein
MCLRTLARALTSGSVYNTFVLRLSPLEEADNSRPLSLEAVILLYQEAFTQGRAVRNSTKAHPAQVIIQATHTIDPSKTFTLNSLRKMAAHFNCDRSTVQSYLLSGKVFRGEWIFSKVN